MGKYADLETDIYSIFDSAAWIATNIKTYPANFITVNPGNKYIRVSALPHSEGVNIHSVGGIVMIDIFTSAGKGTTESFAIADLLDEHLVGKSISLAPGVSTQFMSSSCRLDGPDKDNPSLFRATYSIPFNYFRS